jgi:hypothetical protein
VPREAAGRQGFVFSQWENPLDQPSAEDELSKVMSWPQYVGLALCVWALAIDVLLRWF